MKINNSLNVISLIKRSAENNTHANIVDESIKEISCWKVDSSKYKKTILLYFLSLGIIFLINLLWSRIFIKFTCVECKVIEADYLLIVDEHDLAFLIRVKREIFTLKNHSLSDLFNINHVGKEELKNSPYLGPEFRSGRDDIIVFYFRENKYYYLEERNVFKPVVFELNEMRNLEIHNKLGLGIENKYNKSKGIRLIEEYNYLINKFGKNQIKMQQKSFVLIFLEQIINPFYIYQIYALVIWILNDYFMFGIIVCGCSFIILLINSSHQYKNYNRILNFNYSAPAVVNRQFKTGNDGIEKENSNRNSKRYSGNIMISEGNENKEGHKRKKVKNPFAKHESEYIVPGDVVILKNDELVPCDCLILDGYCTVNESDLTGESTLVMKYALPLDNREFNYEANKKSFLFQGTRIMKCESNSEYESLNCIYALAVNTGYNTIRGNLIQNILFPKPTNFKFYKDIKIFFLFMMIVWLFTIIPLVYIATLFEWELGLLIKKIFDNITVLLPPTLPICLTFTSFYFHFNLSNKRISCISDKKMNAAGRVNILVLDKTGTLTEEGLEVYGFQTTKYDSVNLEFDDIQTNSKVYNRVLKTFWSKFCDDPEYLISKNYQTSLNNNVVFFLECLATCHSIDKLKNDSLGNSIDKKIFDKLKWTQEKFQDKEKSDLVKYFMFPKNAYKISESFIFNQRNLINLDPQNKKYKLIIIKRFEFSSQFQSMSVVVKNMLDGSNRFFIKGAPEKITQVCDPKTLPVNFDNKHMEHTKNGFRVLACATKVLPPNENYEYEEDRVKFESNLTFLGFIIFKNKLKRDTKHVISNLKNSNCKLILATGDNPFTSLSVARECELVEDNGSLVYLIDIYKEYNEEEEKLKITSLREEHSREEFQVEPPPQRKLTISKRASYKSDRKRSTRSIIHGNSVVSSDRRLLQNRDSNFIDTTYEKTLIVALRNIVQNKVTLCVSGKVFSYLTQKIKEEEQQQQQVNELITKSTAKRRKSSDGFFSFTSLIKVIGEKGRIFYRMSPNDKADLINFYKEDKTSIVAMCGDGANDCAALLTADVGISLAQSKGNVAAHFYSVDESISCIELILKNGRACLENSIIIFKYMILYAVIQITCFILFCSINQDMTSNQYILVDCFISLFAILLACKTGSNYKLVKDNPTSSILNPHFFINVIGQSIIQISSQVGYFYFLKTRVKIEETDVNEISVFQSYLWIFTIFQYLSVLFILNSVSKHRKKFYANKSYIFYFTLITFLLICQITSKNFQNFFFGIPLCNFEDGNKTELQITSEINKVITLVWSILNFGITYLYEILINCLFAIK